MDAQDEATPAGGPLADSGATNPHELIEFVSFAADGSEEVRQGRVWGAAPRYKGQRVLWVLPVDPDGSVSAYPAVAVVVASRRHRVGSIGRTLTGREVWVRGGGRYVDIGTKYHEESPVSPTGRMTTFGAKPPAPPTAIMVPPLDPATFAALSGDTSLETLLQ